MRHNYLNDTTSAHFAVNASSDEKHVLVQLGDETGNQVRIALSQVDALVFAQLIKDVAVKLYYEVEKQ